MIKKIVAFVLILLFVIYSIPIVNLTGGVKAAETTNPFASQDIQRNQSIEQSKKQSAVEKTPQQGQKPENKLDTNNESSIKHYNVKFKDSASLSEIYSCVSHYTYQLLGQSTTRLFKIDTDDIKSFNNSYSSLIDSVTEDATMKIAATTDDTYFAEQWELPDINIPQAWDVTKGSSNIKVAVIDTGFDRSHEDFNSAQILNGCDITDSDSAVTTDAVGHGTEVTSVIAAATNNNEGIAGAGWNVDVMPYKVADDSGTIYESSVITAITMAADAGCDVISMSLGSYQSDSSMQAAINYANNAKGCIVVAAAGNEGSIGNAEAGQLSYPASYNGVISVAAVDRNNNRSDFSQYNSSVDVAAPGEGILVAEPNSETGYTVSSGTSFSTPYVASVAALARSVDKSITTTGFQQLVEQTSTDLGDASRDNYYGWGLINAKSLVDAAKCPIVYGVDDNGLYNVSKTITFSRGTAKLNGNVFSSGSTVSVNGTYVLVVTDSLNNTTTIHFTLDNVPPVVNGVANGQSYNTDRLITFTEGTATLNGNTFKSGDTVSDEGSYTLIVKDAAGNTTTAVFSIDKMPPVITGVEDGKTYNSAVVISFNEGNAKLNNNSFSNNTTISTVGNYTLTVADGAGNSTTAHFTISNLPTTVSMPMTSQLTQWVMDSGSGYLCAISQNDKKLFFINPTTMQIDSTLTLSAAPTDIIADSGKLYIALDSANHIQVVDITTKTLGSVLSTATDPYRLVKDGDSIFYTQYDQWCEIHKYDLVSNTDTKLCTRQEGSYGKFCEPALAVNTTLHILYIGESGSSGSKLYYYDETQGKITETFNYDSNSGFYFPSRNIVFDGQNLWYAGTKFDVTNPSNFSENIYGSSPLLLAGHGCLVSAGGSVNDENTYQKIGTFSSSISLVQDVNASTLLYYDNANNCIKKAVCGSTIGADTMTGLLSGKYASSLKPGNSIKINNTIQKVQMNVPLDKWISDDSNEMLYAISSSSKCLYMIDQQTMNIEDTIELPGTPADIIQGGGEVYVALNQDNKIAVVNLTSRNIEKVIQTTGSPLQIVIDENYLFYVSSVLGDVHKYNLTTDTDTLVTTNFSHSFSRPCLAVNTNSHILYIGESGSSGGCHLYYYAEAQGEIVSQDNYDGGYGFANYDRTIQYNGTYVLYASRVFDPADATHIVGSLGDINGVTLEKNGLIIAADSASGIDFFDSASFVKIGTSAGNIKLGEMSGDGKVFLFNYTDNTAECIQSPSGTIDTDNIVSLISGTPAASPIQPTSGQKMDVDTLGLSMSAQITKWQLDENSHTIYAISASNKALLFINSDTMNLEKVLSLKGTPDDIFTDSGKVYVSFQDTNQILVINMQSRLVDSTIYIDMIPRNIVKAGNIIYYSSQISWGGYVYKYDLNAGTSNLILSGLTNPDIAINTDSHILYIGDRYKLQYYDIAQAKVTGSSTNTSSVANTSILIDGTSVYFNGNEYSGDTPTSLGSYGASVIFAKNGLVFTNTSGYLQGSYSSPFYTLPLSADLVELSQQDDLFIFNNANHIIEKICASDVSGVEDGVYDDQTTITFDSGTVYLDNQPITSGTTVTEPGDHELLYFDENNNCEAFDFYIARGVQSVSLNKTQLDLDINGKETLIATIMPSDAYNQYVTWSSSDDNIATVDDNGRVRGVSAGDAVITVTTDDGAKTATCQVHVSTTVLPFDVTRPVVEATAGDGSATLNWDAVSGATAYAIAYQNGSNWVALSLNCTDTTYTATNLVSGKTYTFVVQAKVNGSWSKFDSTDYVTATPTGATKPAAAVTAVGDGSVTLKWNAVSGATKYAIAYQNGSSWVTLTPNCTNTTYKATGLINGKAYTFLVQSYADGKWSSFNSSDYVTGTPIDAARPVVKATAGDGSAALTWDAVANATAYAIAYQNGSNWVALSLNCTDTAYTATNLVSGKTYTFLVQAKVNGSWSKFDNTDYVTATPTGAAKPTAVVTAIGDGSATLTWNAISGATIYTIAYQNGSNWVTLTPNCTGTTYTATGLTNHKEYTFLVQSYADGKWSSFNSSDYVTGTPLDAARPVVKATAGDGSAALTWDAVANATAYAVAYQNGSNWVALSLNCTDTAYTATNLVAGKTYTFLVQAKVNGSWSKFDSTDLVTATPTGAAKPAAAVTAVGDGSATLSWNAVSGATKYAIEYQNGSSWGALSLSCTDTAYTASNLVAGKTYTFLVQSYADGKWSSFSSSDYVTATPTGATKPAAAVTAVGDGSVTLSWNAVSGATIYAVAYQNGSSWVTLTPNCTGTAYTATGLTNHKEYTFLVQSYADGKWSSFNSSDYVTGTPLDATRPVVKATAGDGSAALTWNAVSGATAYAIAYQNGSSWVTLTTNCTGTTYAATNLVAGKTYTFLVQAKVNGSWSKFDSTDLVTATPTGATKPAAAVTAVGDGSVTLSWNAVSGATIYAVAYQNGSSWVTLTPNCTNTTYKATGLINGKAYTFLVQSYADGKWSSFNSSDYVTGTPLDATRPVVKATAGDGKVTLTWNAVSGATAYAVAYQNGSSWVTLTTNCTDTTYAATNLVAGKTYTFLVQAKVNGSWSKFDSTDLVTATPTGN